MNLLHLLRALTAEYRRLNQIHHELVAQHQQHRDQGELRHPADTAHPGEWGKAG